MNKILIIITLLGIVFTGKSQQTLSVSDALASMMENNYGIIIAKNNLEISENNSSILNSGLLPSVSGRAGINYANKNADLEYLDGTSLSANGVESAAYDASINAGYTLFDGLGNIYNYRALKLQYNLSELETKAMIEETSLNLLSSYYVIAQLVEQEMVLNEVIEISKERLDRALSKQEYGAGSELVVLNAKVDLNNDSIQLINLQSQLINLKQGLNFVMGKELNIDFNIDTNFSYHAMLPLLDLINHANQNNTQLNMVKEGMQLSLLNQKIINSLIIPRVDLNASYGYNNNETPSSSVIKQETLGISAGASLSWNIFDKGSTLIKMKNAKINYANQEEMYRQAKMQIELSIRSLYQDYVNSLYTLEKEKSQVNTSFQNFNYSKDKYELGQITNTEFRLAQLNLTNAQLNYRKLRYEVKLAEIALLKEAGLLLI